jgi:uncharacterized protein (TIGR02145 family)
MENSIKIKKNLFSVLCSAVCCLVLTSCVNTISEGVPEKGSIPISLSTSIQSRVEGSQFGHLDTIGVYLLSDGEAMSGNRYLDNIPFYFENAKPVSKEMLFYPYDASKCSFISYFPYRQYAITAGSGSLMVSVSGNQQSKEDFAASDFMLAKTKDVVPSKKAVALHHEHQFSLLDIALEPTSGTTAEDLKAANPKVTLLDVYTRGYFDVETEKISSLEVTDDIIPNGDWKVVDGKLIGKSVILVPQPVSGDASFIKLTIGGRDLIYSLGNDFTFDVAKRNTLTIPCSETKINNISITIADWIGGEDKNAQSVPVTGGIPLASLPFDRSKVCNLYSNKVLVGQICKEYLLGNNIDAQAIVAYHVVNGKVDSANGTILKILGGAASTGCGTVKWTSSNTLLYTSGNRKNAVAVYVGKSNVISGTKPEDAQSISVEPYMMVDKRGGESKTYSVVKIGSQYWMAEDLVATTETDGSAISQKEELNDTETSPCYISKNGSIFYNEETINTLKMVPDGWKIPSETDWTALNVYIDGDARKVKAADWIYKDYIPSDITGFHVQGKGIVTNWNNDDVKGVYDKYKQGVCYWYLDDTATEVGGRCRFIYLKNELQMMKWAGEPKLNNMKAASLRLLRK